MTTSYLSHVSAGGLIDEGAGIYVAIPEAEDLQRLELELGGRFRYLAIPRAKLQSAVDRATGIARLDDEVFEARPGMPLPVPVIADSHGERFVIRNLASARYMLESRTSRFTILQLCHFD